MDIKIVEDIFQLEFNHPIVYFNRSYLASQNHNQLIDYAGNNIQLMVVVSGNMAISIPKSPFGSFFSSDDIDQSQFGNFLKIVKDDLKNRGVNQLAIHHPSEIYESFAPHNFLIGSGFEKTYTDVNQHIPLNKDWKENLHKMQMRKLRSLHENGFEFRKMEESELETAHQFISACRQVQGLSINIEWEHLKNLNEGTHAYESFGVFRDKKLSAVCITVKASDKVAYYYLPATSPTFRTESPMVMLIEGMADYYRSKGFQFFDMGVSSVLGKPQESLLLFKERMGAVRSDKPTFTLAI